MPYTDYPKIDIKTNRSIARWQKRAGIIIGMGGLYLATIDEPMAGFVLAAGAFAFAFGHSMEIQAIEWEIEQTADTGEADQ